MFFENVIIGFCKIRNGINDCFTEEKQSELNIPIVIMSKIRQCVLYDSHIVIGTETM